MVEDRFVKLVAFALIFGLNYCFSNYVLQSFWFRIACHYLVG